MRLSKLDRKLTRDLWRIKGQALAVALVVGAGIATVVMAVGTYLSLSETRATYYERYRFADVFAHTDRAPLHLTGRIAEIDGVQQIEARIVKDALLDMPGLDEPARALLHSLPEDAGPRLNALVLRAGRLVEASRPDEVIINEAFAQSHRLAPGDNLSAVVNGKLRDLHIAGIAMAPEFVYIIGPGDLVPDEQRFAILWMGRDALEAAFDFEGAFNDLSLSLARGADTQAVTDALDRLLEPYANTGAYDRQDHISDSFVRSEMEQLRHQTFILPPVFLAVAAFLVAMVMNRLVETEREQIGLAKAFGYRNHEIGLHYLKLVLIVTLGGVLLGSVVGTLMGRWVTALYAQSFQFPYLAYVVDFRAYTAAGAASLAAASLGALGAVARAVRLPPAVAMRAPPPTRYAKGLMEDAGVGLPLPRLWRMATRHIWRYPIRSALAVTGISASVAILVMTFFFSDAIETMLQTFFFETERQDMTVRFATDEGDAIANALYGLPGVRLVELRRHATARLNHGPVTERVTIIGLDGDATLTGLAGPDGGSPALPPAGLVLSDALAAKLGVGIGEAVRVEVLEGRRPARDIPVSLVVQSLIGLMAYMDRAALNRLMMDGPVADSAYLRVDPLMAREFYAEVKTIPAISGVSSKHAAHEKFRRIMDQQFLLVVSFYVALALATAMGVVYNNGRIALSERARELASLRVLGFRRSEVAEILLVEIAILTILALPLGCLLGSGLVALIVDLFSSDLYRIPDVVFASTYGMAMAIVIAATVLAGFVVAWRVHDLDLIAVLKSRE